MRMKLLFHDDGEVCDTPTLYGLLCGGGDFCDGENSVHAAGAIALRVESDVEEAEGAKCSSDVVEGFERECTGEFVTGDFDASKVAVMADADLLEAEVVKSFFGLFDLREIFASDGATVFDARGETG